jgi:hypothetical protein
MACAGLLFIQSSDDFKTYFWGTSLASASDFPDIV